MKNGSSKSLKLVDFVKDLKALTYPQYLTNIYKPPMILLEVGDFFKMRGFCTVSVSWKKPLREGRYVNASVTIQVTEALKKSFGMDDILGSKDLNNYPDFYS